MSTGRVFQAIRKGALALLSSLLVFTMGGAAFAQAAENPTDVLAAADRERFTFTLRAPSLTNPESSWALERAPDLELSAGGKWRFTFSIDQARENPFALDDVRAGAAFDFTPRMRFSGELSFADEDDAITQAGDFDRDVPQVKFESAFRF